MIYFLIFLIIILCIFMIFMFYMIHRNTAIVDGKIIRVDKKLNSMFTTTGGMARITTIMYSYVVDQKKYINTVDDIFGMSNLLYKYIKTEQNKKKFEDEYIYYVKKPDIKVRYKINNPKDSKINNLMLKEFLYLYIFGGIICIILGLIFSLILWHI